MLGLVGVLDQNLVDFKTMPRVYDYGLIIPTIFKQLEN